MGGDRTPHQTRQNKIPNSHGQKNKEMSQKENLTIYKPYIDNFLHGDTSFFGKIRSLRKIKQAANRRRGLDIDIDEAKAR